MNAGGRERYPSPLATRSLWLALAVSLLAHALLLSLHFTFPDASRAFQDRALEIVLVNSRSARKPAEAQVLAQASLDGGGNTEQEHIATTPLPPARVHHDGSDLEHSQRRVQELEARQQRLAAQARSRTVAAPTPEQEVQPEPSPAISGSDLASSALAMARLEGAIGKELDEYNQRPRKKFIGTRADEYRFAQYVEEWRSKIERVGTLNYPQAARGKLYGTLVLTVTLRSDGTVASVEINRSSGHKILDDAARRIVSMAAPFADFPPAIRRDTDLLVITRSWRFTQRDSLETKAR
ncbi:MAG TPA: energy transducer TonB [Candidatus Accumulibacter sp.]|nr:energy transducer TonB [Accumulibacter sp.]